MDTNSINSKLPHIGTTIFTVMSKMALDHGAINLSQGFPDFEISEELVDLVSHYMKKGFNQYAPMQGVSALRDQLSRKFRLMYDIHVDAEKEITITAGATEALYAAIAALVREGDEVIIFDPAYDSYEPAITLNGGKTIHIQVSLPDFAIDWDEVKSKISDKTRLIIINNPHNPTGTILQKSDLDQLSELIKNKSIFVLSDEVYEHLTFDNQKHNTVLNHPQLREKSIAVFSFGKTFHTTGWKTGYAVAPEALSRELRRVHQYLTFCVNTPVQYALADYLKNESHYLHLNTFFQTKRDLFLDLMKHSRFEPIQSYGTYFQLFSYKQITSEPDTLFAERLTKEIGVASIPVSVFNQSGQDEKLLRFCFAKKDQTLKQAAEILCKI